MDCLASLWEDLLDDQSQSLFQKFSWNRLAAEIFIDRVRPHVVCVETDGGAAIIPAAINKATGRLEFLGEILFDYRDALHRGDGNVLRLAWQKLCLLGHELSVVAVHKQAAQTRWDHLPLQPFANAPQVDRNLVDESAFRMAHSRLGRQMRRLRKEGAELHIDTGANSAIVARLYENKRSQFAASQDNVFHDQLRCEFMIAAAAMESESCEVYTLQRGSDEMIAGIVTFRDGDVRRFYTIYFDPVWARYSPGLALLYEVTGRSLGQGLSCDYMTGEYPYKLRLANASLPLYQLQMTAQQLLDMAERESRAA